MTQKTGTFEMRSGSHVQLAALRNRDLELQTTWPFSTHGSVERSTACFRHKNVFTKTMIVGKVGRKSFKSSRFFCVILYLQFYIFTILFWYRYCRMNERNLNEGQWQDRKQWSLGVGQRRKTF
jgi:hypothetical protein